MISPCIFGCWWPAQRRKSWRSHVWSKRRGRIHGRCSLQRWYCSTLDLIWFFRINSKMLPAGSCSEINKRKPFPQSIQMCVSSRWGCWSVALVCLEGWPLYWAAVCLLLGHGLCRKYDYSLSRRQIEQCIWDRKRVVIWRGPPSCAFTERACQKRLLRLWLSGKCFS